MRFRIVVAATAAALAAVLAMNSAFAEWDAADNYKLRCSTCHGSSGQGTAAPPLAPPLKGNPFVINAPAPVLVQLIRHGRVGRQRVYHEAYANMPSFGPEAVPDPEALVQYLKTGLQQ